MPPAKPNEPPNPFYSLLLGVSSLFVITVLAYVMLMTVPARPGMPPGGLPLGRLLDRHGTDILGVELTAIVACSIGAMVLDRWRTRRRAGPRAPASAEGPVNPAGSPDR